jgi:hypothetical protein
MQFALAGSIRPVIIPIAIEAWGTAKLLLGNVGAIAAKRVDGPRASSRMRSIVQAEKAHPTIRATRRRERPRGRENRALVEAATFSPELADLTMTAPSIESRRDAQHAHCARHAGT